MTQAEQVKMLTTALTGLKDWVRDNIKNAAVIPAQVTAVVALAATAEPATLPTYSADDLRKVAEAVEEARLCVLCGGPDLDLDAIIAKAVGR